MLSLMRRVLTTVWEAPSPKLLQSQFPLLVTTGQICFFPNFVFSRIYDVFLGVSFFFFGHSSDLRRCRDNAGPLTHCAPENPANLLMSGLIDSQLLLFVFLVFVSTLNLLQLSHASGNPFYTHKRIKVKRHCLSSRMTNGFHIMVAPFFFSVLSFPGPHPQHMEFPRLGV